MNSIDPDVQALLYFKDEQYREVFCKLPMVLLTNEKYAELTNNARVAYALLTSRFELSFKNNWIDDSGAIYFYYTTKNLAQDIHVSERTAVKVRQELVQASLLNIQKQGLHKPSRLYLLKPVIATSDFSKIDQLQSKMLHPKTPQRNEKGQLTRDAKSALLEESHKNKVFSPRDADLASLNTQDLHTRYINNQINLLNPNSDTLSTETLSTDTSKSQDSSSKTSKLQQALTQYKKLDQANSVFSPTAFNLLTIFSDNSNIEVETFCKLIFKAKDSAFHEVGLYSKYLDLRNFPHTIEKTLYRILKQIKNGQIQKIDKYFFKTFREEFRMLSQKYLIWNQEYSEDPSKGNENLAPKKIVTEKDLAQIDSATIRKIFG